MNTTSSVAYPRKTQNIYYGVYANQTGPAAGLIDRYGREIHTYKMKSPIQYGGVGLSKDGIPIPLVPSYSSKEHGGCMECQGRSNF